MRRYAPQGPPSLRNLLQSAGIGTSLAAERQSCGFLQGKIAGWESIGMAKAKQQEDVGRPRADSFHGDKRAMRLLGGKRQDR
jgi:hypothetical protein